LEESLSEDRALEREELLPVGVGAIAPAEGDAVAVVADEPAIGDGDPAGVAGEVTDDVLGAEERSSDVDVPVAPPGITEQLVAGVAPHVSLAVTEEHLEFVQELGLEDDLQDAAGQQIAAAMDEGVRTRPTPVTRQ
jgi:hypothetical protein